MFPSTEGGYWLTGYQADPSGARKLAIARIRDDGSYDTTYNGTGRRLIASTMVEVVDVAKGPSDTFYFVGTQRTGTNIDLDIQIACVDGDGTPCQGFGSNGVDGIWLDLSADPANRDDRPNRIVWYGAQLYVVGETATDAGVGTSRNPAAFAIHLNPVTGDEHRARIDLPHVHQFHVHRHRLNRIGPTVRQGVVTERAQPGEANRVARRIARRVAR